MGTVEYANTTLYYLLHAWRFSQGSLQTDPEPLEAKTSFYQRVTVAPRCQASAPHHAAGALKALGTRSLCPRHSRPWPTLCCLPVPTG